MDERNVIDRMLFQGYPQAEIARFESVTEATRRWGDVNLDLLSRDAHTMIPSWVFDKC
jgi:hypothetical protein